MNSAIGSKHIPHRIRAAIARLPMENSLLRVQACIDPECLTEMEKVYWRCATDSIWEGRLAATRWLIEFIGVRRDEKGGKAIECKKMKGYEDIRIDDIDGGELFDLSSLNAQSLADVWKGCSQASSHATKERNHPEVSDLKELPEVLGIILNHLQDTIYNQADKNIRDCVLRSRD